MAASPGRVEALRLVLADQLTSDLASLRDADPARDVILLCEVMEEASYVPHHKQKIAFLFSAMRHFAAELTEAGFRVDYVRLDDPENGGSFEAEMARAVARHDPKRIVLTFPGEFRVLEKFEAWGDAFERPVIVREDDRFLCSRERFAEWARDRRHLRMEFFYREMRRETGLLMEGDKPAGGQWNFDADNRKRLPADVVPPDRRRFEPDAVTREVLALVESRFADHFGTLDRFGWATTRADALLALEDFVANALPRFGDFQDAMKAGEDFLFHGLVSPYLNAGLLTAREVCAAAEAAWKAGGAPLNAAEGFVRQILGWREYIRGIYWLDMPAYQRSNALGAERPLPNFYWTGDTRMRCVAECVRTTRDNAYAHHIQRLMVTGNFGLVAGLRPGEVEAWYLAVYADAYDWVELPNTHGMILWADGGRLGSKPYAASGAYINRMSDYCGGCHYDVAAKAGERACPFNYLYWDFLIRNEARLAGNPRLSMPYRTLGRMSDARRREVQADARRFLESDEMRAGLWPGLGSTPRDPASEARPGGKGGVAAAGQAPAARG